MVKHNLHADIVIIGGSLGGCSAALAALKTGKKVILTEETAWIGGQLTNQAVPPDEHPWIEKFGSSSSYRELRNRIRDYYYRNYPLREPLGDKFNPGNAIVSRISHEPKVALHVLNELLSPYLHSRRLVILTKHKIVEAETDGDRVISVTVESLLDQSQILTASYFIDATELGDVLPLANVEYVTGAESKMETEEPHAVDGPPQPMNMQAFTYCFAMDHLEGENHVIEKPDRYDFWKNYQADFWPDRQLSWSGIHPPTMKPVTYSLFEQEGTFSLWKYRRLIDHTQFEEGFYKSDISLVNWPANDYWIGPIIDVNENEKRKHLENAKQLSLSLLYWMQTEAPRPDGGNGYPGLRLRKDIVGTTDGLAMYPYIRESRRIKAEFTILEQHISAEIEGKSWSTDFKDTVGIGCYRLDLHPSTGGDNYIDHYAYPFQIPLGCLIPVRMKNLIPASKNIGTTHLSNGCYRLHPVEWGIGEAAGFLVSYCIDKRTKPTSVRNNEGYLQSFQELLTRQGVELQWLKLTSV
ncbi:FAD-dependent oxidoreductase [Pseudalkalibacillus sp. A8]|uniref:FAD-dependent oxidoreductase n=1 Tax=Pseudalkalibacillus sp. A8 TaxID=3382641 RepID=UPI0038B41C47